MPCAEYCYLKDYVKPHKELNKTDCFKIAEKIVENENWRPQAIWLTGGEPTILSFLNFSSVCDIRNRLAINSVLPM